MNELTLEITNKCLQNCNWCSSGSQPGGTHTDLNTLKGIMIHWSNEGLSTIRISGGEPTLHPNLPEILGFATSYFTNVVLLTSGPKDSRPWLKFLQYTECIVSVVNTESLVTALNTANTRNVSMQVVMALGNEDNILRAMKASLKYEMPLRLVVLQNQGRAKLLGVKPLKTISWTGDSGCNLLNKITVAHDRTIATCSALKYGNCTIIEGNSNARSKG